MSRDAWRGLISLLAGVFLVFWAVNDVLTGFRDFLLVVGIILISLGDTWGLERLRRSHAEVLRRLDTLERGRSVPPAQRSAADPAGSARAGPPEAAAPRARVPGAGPGGPSGRPGPGSS